MTETCVNNSKELQRHKIPWEDTNRELISLFQILRMD